MLVSQNLFCRKFCNYKWSETNLVGKEVGEEEWRQDAEGGRVERFVAARGVGWVGVSLFGIVQRCSYNTISFLLFLFYKLRELMVCRMRLMCSIFTSYFITLPFYQTLFSHVSFLSLQILFYFYYIPTHLHFTFYFYYN